ncbi:MAG: hypothetical protein A2Z12_10335 [Actinobacteria bacterium RBG_16_68_21]|nr:MAG: hypothetical protein A2Z12_10335 [Actinobacteria bacterium RBG_16_68_21]
MLALMTPVPTDGPAAAGLPGATAVSEMSDGELHEFYLERRRRERAAAAEGAMALAEIDRRRSFLREGYLSAAAFVAHRSGDSHRAAAGLVRIARSLPEMPHTSAAFHAGEIGSVRVRRLIDAWEAAPHRFATVEEALVDRGCHQDARTFTQTVDLWRQNAAAGLSRLEERERFERRRLSFSETIEGMVHVDADLDPVSGETVISAIRALSGPADRDDADGRTSTQRRADALGEICRRYLDSGDAPISGGQRPHLNVIVDIDGLTGGAVTRSEIGEGRVLGPAAREFLACDATVCAVLMEGPDEVLQMGRRARTATPAQLRALAVRDGGCVIPGCGRPPGWCDAHHEVPWIRGGLTNVEGMRLVCRPHHVMIHLGLLDLPKRE